MLISFALSADLLYNLSCGHDAPAILPSHPGADVKKVIMGAATLTSLIGRPVQVTPQSQCTDTARLLPGRAASATTYGSA